MSAFLNILSSNEIISESEIFGALETPSVSDIVSVRKTFGSLETLSVRDRDSPVSVMSASLEILSSSEIDSESKRLTVPDNAISVSRDNVSASEISAILEILSVRDIDSVSLIPDATEVLSVSDIVSDM